MPSASPPACLVGQGRWGLAARHIATPRSVNGRMGHFDVNPGRSARVSPTPRPDYSPMAGATARQWRNGPPECDFGTAKSDSVRSGSGQRAAARPGLVNGGMELANASPGTVAGRPTRCRARYWDTPIRAWSRRQLGSSGAGRGYDFVERGLRYSSSGADAATARRTRDAATARWMRDARYGSSDASRVRSRSSR